MSGENKRIQAIVAGHLCFDLQPTFIGETVRPLVDIFVPGKLIDMDSAVFSTGGAVSNCGLTMKNLGLDVRLMGKIGTDPFGDLIHNLLSKQQAEAGLIRDPETTTSYSVVIAPPGIDRIFLHHPGANDTYRTDDLNLEQVASARLFHFGYPPLMREMYRDEGSELARLLTTVKAQDVTTSLDLALPDPKSPAGRADWPLILSRALPHTDVFVPSIEELAYMFDRPSYERTRETLDNGIFAAVYGLDKISALASRALELGARIVVVKLGKFGFYVRTASCSKVASIGPAAPADPENWANREILAPPFDVPRIASTSGSGDASIAGFLAGLLGGLDVVSAARLACAVAALKIQVHGSVGGTRPMPEVIAMMPEWPPLPVDVRTDGWDNISGGKLWRGPADNGVIPAL